jgi:hypothetical protein
LINGIDASSLANRVGIDKCVVSDRHIHQLGNGCASKCPFLHSVGNSWVNTRGNNQRTSLKALAFSDDASVANRNEVCRVPVSCGEIFGGGLASDWCFWGEKLLATVIRSQRPDQIPG